MVKRLVIKIKEEAGRCLLCHEPMGAEIGENPELVERYTAAVRKGTGLPVLAKMTPNITHMEEPAKAAVAAGADGIAAIRQYGWMQRINPYWMYASVWAATCVFWYAPSRLLKQGNGCRNCPGFEHEYKSSF